MKGTGSLNESLDKSAERIAGMAKESLKESSALRISGIGPTHPGEHEAAVAVLGHLVSIITRRNGRYVVNGPDYVEDAFGYEENRHLIDYCNVRREDQIRPWMQPFHKKGGGGRREGERERERERRNRKKTHEKKEDD